MAKLCFTTFSEIVVGVYITNTYIQGS